MRPPLDTIDGDGEVVVELLGEHLYLVLAAREDSGGPCGHAPMTKPSQDLGGALLVRQLVGGYGLVDHDHDLFLEGIQPYVGAFPQRRPFGLEETMGPLHQHRFDLAPEHSPHVLGLDPLEEGVHVPYLRPQRF